MTPSTRKSALLALVVVLAGCGGEDEPAAREGPPAPTQTTAAKRQQRPIDPAALARRPAGEAGLRVPARRAQIVAKGSRFGRVLFDANGQVVYVFENDRRNRTACTSADCVKAWPPVLTRDPPAAGTGIDAGLLGTVRRPDGKLQVTYNGRPLYFYEHEAPGEIKCHDVDLHGGLWWVVTPSGERLT
jgi:predicted lipoprotein with Yx(FWY)xxD motif